MNYVPLPLNKELLPSYRDLNQSPRVIFVGKIGSLLYTLCESRWTELRILRWFGKLFHKCDQCSVGELSSAAFPHPPEKDFYESLIRTD